MKDLFRNIAGIKVYKKERLSKYTSFNIGGYADYLIKVYSKGQLKNVLQIIKKNCLKYFVIGAGTNILVSDKGYRGVVIKLCRSFKRIHQQKNLFSCGAAMSLNDFLKRTYDAGYGGAEFLAGIPGTIGGAIKGNAGAFGHSIGEITEKIAIIDDRLHEKEMMRQEIGFGYRRSQINNQIIIIGAELNLVKKKKNNIIKMIEENIKKRRAQHPVGFSAGSFFKNPPGYPAGKLIDECGLKGHRIGDAMVSPKHGNFIINCGAASAASVIKLARRIQKIVKEKKGIILEPEVKIVW